MNTRAYGDVGTKFRSRYYAKSYSRWSGVSVSRIFFLNTPRSDPQWCIWLGQWKKGIHSTHTQQIAKLSKWTMVGDRRNDSWAPRRYLSCGLRMTFRKSDILKRLGINGWHTPWILEASNNSPWRSENLPESPRPYTRGSIVTRQVPIVYI